MPVLQAQCLTRPNNDSNEQKGNTDNKRLKELEVFFVQQGKAKLLHLPLEGPFASLHIFNLQTGKT
jgi:hypothetical protein